MNLSKVREGLCIKVSGPTGCGKSRVTMLLMRQLEEAGVVYKHCINKDTSETIKVERTQMLKPKVEGLKAEIAQAEARLAELKSSLDRAERLGWPVSVTPGGVFMHKNKDYYITRATGSSQTRDRFDLVCISGFDVGRHFMLGHAFNDREDEFTYIGHAKDVLRVVDPGKIPLSREAHEAINNLRQAVRGLLILTHDYSNVAVSAALERVRTVLDETRGYE